MDVNAKPSFQFGSVELELKDFHIACVEFPLSWPRDERDVSKPLASRRVESHRVLVSQNTNLEQTQPSRSVTNDINISSTSTRESNYAEEAITFKFSVSPDADVKANSKHGTNATKVSIQDVDIKDEISFKKELPNISNKEEISQVLLSSSINNSSANKEVNVEQKTEEAVKDENNVENDKPAKEEAKQKNQSWAGLFNNSNSSLKPATKKTFPQNSNPPSLIQQGDKTNFSETSFPKFSTRLNHEGKSGKSVTVVKPEDDVHAGLFAKSLLDMQMIFKPQAFIPRGLINVSNWCYINATLQALLVCPPFFKMLKSMPLIHPSKRTKTCTPILDSFIHLVSEFKSLSLKRNNQANKDVRYGPPFQPTYVYQMLTTIESTLSETGSQEDAEEFLSCVLNGIHEEMTGLLLNCSADSSPLQQRSVSSEANCVDDVANNISSDMDEWEEVGRTKRNRSAVTRRADVSKTLLSEIFRGELCTSVFRPGHKASVSYEPFFCLPLYVPSDHPSTIEDALLTLTGKESITDDDDTDSNASRQQTINVLPPILILHLKRFVYNKTGGSKKIDKKMEYNTELVLGKELLSKSSKKQSLGYRSYKLFAVVYHHGEKVTGGHYTTDVFHFGMNSWLRIDDKNIWPVPQIEVTRHNSNRTAYLLYYIRNDL